MSKQTNKDGQNTFQSKIKKFTTKITDGVKGYVSNFGGMTGTLRLVGAVASAAAVQIAAPELSPIAAIAMGATGSELAFNAVPRIAGKVSNFLKRTPSNANETVKTPNLSKDDPNIVVPERLDRNQRLSQAQAAQTNKTHSAAVIAPQIR